MEVGIHTCHSVIVYILETLYVNCDQIDLIFNSVIEPRILIANDDWIFYSYMI